MELVTGRAGSPHITAQQDRQKHQGIWGDGAYILNTGNMLEPEVQSSNKILIKDGALMFQGALFSVKVGTTDEITINNGNQGMQRKDLVVARYKYHSSQNIESAEWVVIQGTPVASNPVAPTGTDGDIQAGDATVDCPFMVVNLDGINVTGVDLIPEVAPDIPTLNASLADSGWIEMTSSISFAEKPMFRKIGKTVYVGGTIRYSDNGIFRNDEIIGDIPSEFIPSSSYGPYDCIIPFAFISGSGSRERMYIRGNHVYFAGTSNARDGILAASCYLTD